MSADSSQDAEKLLTVQEACALLGVPRPTLYAWVHRGFLAFEPAPSYYAKPRRYIRRGELERFMREGQRSESSAQVAETSGEYRTPAAS